MDPLKVVSIDRSWLKGEARRFSANWTLLSGGISPLHTLHHLLQSRRCEFYIPVNMSAKRLESFARLELAPVTTHRKLIRREGTYCSFRIRNKMQLFFMIIPGKMKIALFLTAVGNWLYEVAHDDAVILAQHDFEFFYSKSNKATWTKLSAGLVLNIVSLRWSFQLPNLITACTLLIQQF